ncbi:RBBP9/YdeN family alpha/beta hydrolase [Terrilactibacillus laevilacticus]|uniref:RBBP9/YdeN family alpha/beta hydrolase n=1 Tax=Terrilactibacillus laevilacticus TaxID=1380157 RepID=UPI0011468511|nr:alpha/beta fold hydrolase [Terrilactibacillus laevilacticus]
MSRSFVILHGLGGSGAAHWQTWLYKQLMDKGETVYYPSFPEKHHPNKEKWLQILKALMDEIPKDEEIIVVTHSLGCILWFHYAVLTNRKVSRVILVAPPSPYSKVEEIQSFYPVPDNLSDVCLVANKTQLIVSTNDPYCPIEDAKIYLDCGAISTILENKGHINIESGFGPWEWILDQCLNDPVAQ